MKPIENFPAELRALKRWLTWKIVEAPDRKKPIKMPYGQGGAPGKVNDPSTWMTFDEATAAVATGKYNGVGFVFTDTEYTGVDLDWKPDEPSPLGPVFLPDGNLSAWAAGIVGALDSYTERSQSGNGVHIIVRGKLPPGQRRKGPIETYDASSPRYFALTGDVGQRRVIREDDGRLARFHAAFLEGGGVEVAQQVQKTTEKVAAEDPRVSALVAKVKAKSPGFAALYTFGETRPGKSSSESDSWMARELAKYERDPAVIAAAMKASALMRPKWTERRPNSPTGDLIGLAIKDALEAIPARPAHEQHATTSVTIGELVKNGLPKPPPAIVEGLAWRGRITLLAAREGLGKSTLFAEAAAAVTQGRPFLGAGASNPPAPVLWVLVEEHLDDLVIRASHFANGNTGSLDYVHVLERPEDAMPMLAAEVARIKPALIIIDTLHAFAGPMVEHASQSDDWQVVVDGFRAIASSPDAPAVLMAAQASKSTGDYRDSTAIGHGVDVVLTLKRFSGEGEDGPSRELAILKRRFPVPKTMYQMSGQGSDGQPGRLLRVGAETMRQAAEERDLEGWQNTMLRYMVALPATETVSTSGQKRATHPNFGLGRDKVVKAVSKLVERRLAVLDTASSGWRLTESGRIAAAGLDQAPAPRASHATSAMDANEEAANAGQ